MTQNILSNSLPFGLYARVSTEDQAAGYSRARTLEEMAADPEFRQSIVNQIAEARAMIARAGGTVQREYIDAERYRAEGRLVEPSAKRADRPAWRQMLADAEAGLIRGIAAQDHTRLFGDYRPWLDFNECVERNGLAVLLVVGAFDTNTSVMNAWARRQWYREHAYRTAAGRDARARRGLSRTGAPNWYRTIRDEHGRATGYQLIPEYRAFLDEMRDLYLDGLSYSEMARRLRSNPATKRRLDPTTVRRLIETRFNFGEIVTPFGTFAGVHPPAWDEASVRAIRQEMARRHSQRKAPGPRRGVALFAGVLRCGLCGHTMTSTLTKWRGKLYPQYYCQPAQRLDVHRRNSIGEKTLIALLRFQFAQITSDTFDEAIRNLRLPEAMDTAGMARRRAEMQAELEALRSDAERVSPASKALIARQVDDLARQLATLEAQLDAARADTAIDPGAIREWLALMRDPEAWQRPRDELRARIHRLVPALYVADGQLTGAPSSAL